MNESIPMHQRLSNEDVHMISAALRDFQPDPNGIASLAEMRQLLTYFVAAGQSIDLTSYAMKPQNFPERQFEIIADFGKPSNNIFPHYEGSKGIESDAPFVYAIGHKSDTDAADEIVSVLSFRLDHTHKIVLIEQIQGGDTAGKRAVRPLFRLGTPECALYDAVRQFALAINFRHIGIRRGLFGNHSTVQRRAASGVKTATIYERVAEYAKHDLLRVHPSGMLPEYSIEELMTTHDWSHAY